MTEKRFKLDSEIGFIDTQKCGGDTMTLFEVVVELNKLNEENKQLKSVNEDMRRLINNISHQRDEFHRGARENANRIGKLKKENEQLKSEIEKLSYANEDLLEEKRIWKQMSDEYTKLSDDNEQLKKFKEDVFAKIDMHLRMLPTARDTEFNEEDGDPSLYTGAIYMLETLKKELQE